MRHAQLDDLAQPIIFGESQETLTPSADPASTTQAPDTPEASEPDAVDEKQGAKPGEPADERRAVAVGGFLHHHPGGEAEGVGQRADGVVRDLRGGDHIHGVRGVGQRVGGAGGGEHQGVEQVLGREKGAEP